MRNVSVRNESAELVFDEQNLVGGICGGGGGGGCLATTLQHTATKDTVNETHAKMLYKFQHHVPSHVCKPR